MANCELRLGEIISLQHCPVSLLKARALRPHEKPGSQPQTLSHPVIRVVQQLRSSTVLYTERPRVLGDVGANAVTSASVSVNGFGTKDLKKKKAKCLLRRKEKTQK